MNSKRSINKKRFTIITIILLFFYFGFHFGKYEKTLLYNNFINEFFLGIYNKQLPNVSLFNIYNYFNSVIISVQIIVYNRI
jgi:hypothetical protein